jgi:ubiquinone/menaquinone biosynthesis methyltransferase
MQYDRLSPVSNKFYAPGAQRAERVKALFAAIAGRYDLVNDLQSFGLHRYWKRRLIKLAAGMPGEHALDLCCGTGDVAFAFARQGLQVTGLDFSEEMLSIARRRQTSRDLQGVFARPILFLRGDAQRIPFPDNSFDIVTISYGLRNLADMERGLGEMRRVARSGEKCSCWISASRTMLRGARFISVIYGGLFPSWAVSSVATVKPMPISSNLCGITRRNMAWPKRCANWVSTTCV